MKSFPKPLSAKEETEILSRCMEGSKEARDILIERNLRLVAHIVKKYNTAEKEIDDLISIGTIGLIKAIDTFDPDKGIRLATYASRCIDNALIWGGGNNKRTSLPVLIRLSECINGELESCEIE